MYDRQTKKGRTCAQPILLESCPKLPPRYAGRLLLYIGISAVYFIFFGVGSRILAVIGANKQQKERKKQPKVRRFLKKKPLFGHKILCFLPHTPQNMEKQAQMAYLGVFLPIISPQKPCVFCIIYWQKFFKNS